jgi:FXSXX-COOH protein
MNATEELQAELPVTLVDVRRVPLAAMPSAAMSNALGRVFPGAAAAAVKAPSTFFNSAI